METEANDSNSQAEQTVHEEVSGETVVDIPTWQKYLNQFLFLLGAAAFFVFLNYIFGFMKGN